MDTAAQNQTITAAAARNPHVGAIICPFFPVWCTAAVCGNFPSPHCTITPRKKTHKSPPAQQSCPDRSNDPLLRSTFPRQPLWRIKDKNQEPGRRFRVTGETL